MFGLNWLDFISVSVTFLFAVLLHCLEDFISPKQSPENSPTSLVDNKKSPNSIVLVIQRNPKEKPAARPPPATDSNENVENRHSLQITESDLSLKTSSASSTASSEWNGVKPTDAITHTISFDTLSDEFREDEDTISIESLFPCDQSEVYASKKINFIIDELIQTEANYVCNLRKGLASYGAQFQEWPELPEALKGSERQQQLLTNIEDILELHEMQVLPLMQRNRQDLKTLFDEMSLLFDKDTFYCYVLFTMGEKASKELRNENRIALQKYAVEIDDKLGIESLLVQPIQRLTRYPLLLQQFISEFYKSGISCKPVLSSVCKLETRTRRLLDVVNQAEQISSIENLNGLDLSQQGHFRRATEFDALHYPTRKKYRAKIFLFDDCLLCTEVRKRELSFRQLYVWQNVELQQSLDNSKCVRLLLKSTAAGGDNAPTAKKDEYKFTASEVAIIKQWLQTAHKILETARLEYTRREKYTLPIDVVLGIFLALALLLPLDIIWGVSLVSWLIWQHFRYSDVSFKIKVN